MLIRTVIKNVLSFNEEKEFNLLPSPRYSRLSHHKYNVNEINVLKLTAIYGANGAGKSNLIRAIAYLKHIVQHGEIPFELTNSKFRLSEKSLKESQILGIEFSVENNIYRYAIEINHGIILTEELYHSGLKVVEDGLIFERRTDLSGKTSMRFSDEFEKEKENLTLKNVIEKTLTKPEKPSFKLLSELENEYLSEIKEVYRWFDEDLQIILPSSKPKNLIQILDISKTFKEFANDIMCSFGTGIKKIETERKSLKEFLKDNEQAEEIAQKLKNSPQKIIGLINNRGEEIVAINENNELLVKRLVLKHEGENKELIDFYLENESDGTNRLLDYIPAFQHIIFSKKVYLIDEIERSIHPLLIKELLRKFSENNYTQGQLIFTTHESNLLDQDIFRQDEIWFIEKDQLGCSDMYPLSEFKEHHTKDIRKGYLNGRYGAIPFLGNLKDLKWT